MSPRIVKFVEDNGLWAVDANGDCWCPDIEELNALLDQARGQAGGGGDGIFLAEFDRRAVDYTPDIDALQARGRAEASEGVRGYEDGRPAGWTYVHNDGADDTTFTVLNPPFPCASKAAPAKHHGDDRIKNVNAFYYTSALQAPGQAGGVEATDEMVWAGVRASAVRGETAEGLRTTSYLAADVVKAILIAALAPLPDRGEEGSSLPPTPMPRAGE